MPESDPPVPAVETPKAEPRSRRISAVWLVPLLALVVALGVAWRTYSDRGPLIEIIFENASGVVPNETTLRFRDVTIGMVERVDLTPNLKMVKVTARIHKEVAKFVDAEAKFWVVRPSITAQGISGIDTVLSGVYINSDWDDKIGPKEHLFKGLSRQPLTPPGAPGLQVRLRAPDGGSMAIGAPVMFKRITVGRVEDIELNEAGDVMIDIFVNAPNQLRLTEGTRFWNASGFSVEVGPEGASLNVDSLLSLVQGGVSFDTVDSNATPVEAGHIYELYSSESAARQNIFEDAPGQRLMIDVDFDGSVSGLQPGASVEYRGIRVGDVRSLQAKILNDGPEQRVTLRATLALVPQRLGVSSGDPKEVEAAALDLLEKQVKQGLRAQLNSKGLLAQQLFVDLAVVPDAPAGSFDRNAKPYPALPSAPAEISSVATSAQGVLARISSLPLEDVVQGAVTLLANINAIVSDPDVRTAPENLGKLLADARTTFDESGIKEAPAQLAAVLASARALIDQATQAQLVQNLNDVLLTTKASIASVGTAANGVPELVAQIEALTKTANSLPLDQLVVSATRVVDGVDAFVRSDGVAKIPDSVGASLTDLRGVIADLRSGGAVENLNASLASVRQITDAAARADLTASLQNVLTAATASLATIGTSATGVPAVLAQIEALAAKINDLPLDQLVASASQVLGTADDFLASQGIQDVPPKLASALDELRSLLGDLNSGNAAGNVNATLASLRQITDELAKARLTESLQAVIAEAQAATSKVNSAASDLPKLTASLTTLSDNAAALPLDELVASGTQALQTIDRLVASPGVQAVPPKLAEALDELRAILAELNTGGAAANVNATLASADKAAAAITAAAQDLPALIARFSAVADRADAALATVTPNSQLNRDTLLMLQQVRDAARSINALVLALQRQPNSILFGR